MNDPLLPPPDEPPSTRPLDPAGRLAAPTRLRDRFRGCLVGLAIGDSLGGRFEGRSAESVRKTCPDVACLMDYAKDELWYTDDTQMAIGVAETLIEAGGIEDDILCRTFVSNYMPARGYGRGARAVLEAMEEGRDFRDVAAKYFPGGSYGNGAAMRVAPVGMYFYDDEPELLEQARLSALPTHLHPLGIEGAQLIALAVALVIGGQPFHREAFFARLLRVATTHEFRSRLELARTVKSAADLAKLGNGISALESVVTALASFALSPNSFEEAIGRVILLGGDTDTMAAMAGAISGAHVGMERLPSRLVGLLEKSPKGGNYLVELADRLYERRKRPGVGS